MYYNYHAKIKRLIKQNKLLKVKYFEKYNNISPALVFYFDDEKPMPIREYRFMEYFDEFPFLVDYLEM